MLRPTVWWIQNGSITRNGVLPVTILFFWIFCFSLRTSYKELISFTNDPNGHVRTFCKCYSFIWRCFFPVTILNIPQADWLEVVAIWALFERERLKSTFLTGFASLELTTKEDLNPRKQVLLFKALVYPETNNWVYFLQENVYIKKICSVKAKGFCLKFSTFPHLLVLSVSQILLHLLWPGDWHLTSNK